jgi:hypothetical protein
MDKERLEELKLRVSDADAHADMVLVAPSTVGELIAEVEFLTKQRSEILALANASSEMTSTKLLLGILFGCDGVDDSISLKRGKE